MERKGFTLIELMIVVLVIGILAAVGIPKYQSFVIESRARSCMAQLKSVDQAMAVWETKNVAIGFNDCASVIFNPQTGNINGTIYRRRVGAAYAAAQNNPLDVLPPNGGNSILQITKDQRVMACPEVTNKWGGANLITNVAVNSYRFLKTAPTAIVDTWFQDYVPDRIGRACTCYAFGYNANDTTLAAAPSGVQGPAGNQYYPGWGDPNHQREFLHLQWNAR